MVRTKALVSAFSLVAIASALPTATTSSNLEAREYQECEPGTWKSSCGDIHGCFDYDPCVNPPSSVKARQNPSTETPTMALPSTPTPSVATGRTFQNTTSMYYVTPSSPDAQGPKASRFQVSSGPKIVDQVGAFSGIPAGAKKCTLWWEASDWKDRDFTVIGSGSVSAIQLFQINTTNGVSWSDVQKARVWGKEMGFDFSNWNLPMFNKSTNGGFDVDCLESIYIHFGIMQTPDYDVNEFRIVDMRLDSRMVDGPFIKYEL